MWTSINTCQLISSLMENGLIGDVKWIRSQGICLIWLWWRVEWNILGRCSLLTTRFVGSTLVTQTRVLNVELGFHVNGDLEIKNVNEFQFCMSIKERMRGRKCVFVDNLFWLLRVMLGIVNIYCSVILFVYTCSVFLLCYRVIFPLFFAIILHYWITTQKEYMIYFPENILYLTSLWTTLPFLMLGLMFDFLGNFFC